MKTGIQNFYVSTTLDKYEYLCIRIYYFPPEFINNVFFFKIRNGWLYIEIRKDVYKIPQYGKLFNKILTLRLNKWGYYQEVTTPVLWRHKRHSITFALVIDEFSVIYVVKEHALHLKATLEEHYQISEDWYSKNMWNQYGL